MILSLTKTEVKWLHKAASTDPYRRILSLAKIALVEGQVRIVTTDSHRLHCLTPVQEVAGDQTSLIINDLIDLKRLLFEMGKNECVRINTDVDNLIEVSRDEKNWTTLEVARLYGKLEGTEKFPDWTRVVPKGVNPVIHFAVNARYLTDALFVGSYQRTFLYCDLSKQKTDTLMRPILVVDKKLTAIKELWSLDHFAVVMPMSAE